MDEMVPVKRKKEEEEKRKKKGFILLFRRKKLIFLILGLILTLIGLSTSTYAWFTSNFTVSVSEIDVNVSSGSGIQISTDAENWKSMITVDDIISHAYSGATNQVPGVSAAMQPVSTVKTAYAGATTKTQGLHMYKGTIVNDAVTGTMYLDSEEETDVSSNGNVNYIAFDLFLKLDFKEDDGPQTVYFTGSTGVTAGNPNTHIEYASRMGFVVNDSDASSASLSDLRNLNGADAVLIYEPNYDVHTDNGLANGRNNYGVTTRTATGNQDPLGYYGVKAEFYYDKDDTTNHPGTALNSHDTNKFAAVTVDYATEAGNDDPFEFMELPVGVTKIRVYMWIEGQDIDCENTASGGQVKFNLGFTLEGPEEATPTPTPTPGP